MAGPPEKIDGLGFRGHPAMAREAATSATQISAKTDAELRGCTLTTKSDAWTLEKTAYNIYIYIYTNIMYMYIIYYVLCIYIYIYTYTHPGWYLRLHGPGGERFVC